MEHNRSMLFLFLTLIIRTSEISLALAAAQSSEQAPEPVAVSVSRAVGEVGARIVTSREVRFSEAVAQVMVFQESGIENKSEKPNPVPPVLSTADPAFSTHVMRVLDEWTVFLEANEISAKGVDKNEVAKWIKRVGEVYSGSSEWEKIDVSSAELREVIERKLVVQSFESLKAKTAVVIVSDAEALLFFKKNRLRFGNLPFENFKENIKTSLIKTQTDRRLLEWRSVLRRKYKVRNFLGA